MKIYSIYADKKGNYKAVKKGWSWPAFLFTTVWAVIKGVWKGSTCSAIVLSCVFIILVIVANIPPHRNLNLLFDLLVVYMSYFLLALSLIMGSRGNQWIRTKLLRGGYDYQEIILAHSEKAAVMLYITENKHKTSMDA